LGDVFGPGCGTNDDLNESGATTWLESIPNSACSAVNYYTSFLMTIGGAMTIVI
jgi:hypothetical protein